MLDSKALTKIRSIVLIAVIVVAAAGSVATYVLLSEQRQSSVAIKIGILADLDATSGRRIWQGSLLAAEQVNAEGGILGKQVEVIGEDHDFETSQDMTNVISALTRLLTFHNVDFVIGQASGEAGFACQDKIAEHKKIFFEVTSMSEDLTQRVLDDYDRYKYFFRLMFNESSTFSGMTDSLVHVREITGFNKVGYLAEDLGWNKGVREGLDYVLPEVHGFDLVYTGVFPLGTIDFSSYFAAAETAGVQILLPLFWINPGVPLVKEYYDRQSPMVIYGGILPGAITPESWEATDGKCQSISVPIFPITAGFALTSETIPARESYLNRWGESPTNMDEGPYDLVRFILPDAIERAGSLNVDAVIEALEETSIETTQAKNFVFTSSHDTMVGENVNDPEGDYMLVMQFQWQDGDLVPIYPKKIMEEAGATYTFPDWPGPWDNP